MRKQILLVLCLLGILFVVPEIPNVHAGPPGFISTTNAGWANRGTCSPCTVTISSISVTKNQAIIVYGAGVRAGTSASVSDSDSNSYSVAANPDTLLNVEFAKAGSTDASLTITYHYTSNVNGGTNIYVLIYDLTAGLGATAAGTSTTSVSITAQTSTSTLVEFAFSGGGGSCQQISAISATNSRVSSSCFVDISGNARGAAVGDQASTGSQVSLTQTQTNSPTSQDTSALEILAYPLPTVTAISPTSGPIGTTVTVTGTNFNSVTAVTFCGVGSTNFSVQSSTSLTATAPANNPGSLCDILVTANALTSSATTNDVFTYSPATSNNFIVASLPACTANSGCVGGHTIGSGGLFNYILFECAVTTNGGNIAAVTWDGLANETGGAVATGTLVTDIFTTTATSCSPGAQFTVLQSTLIARSATLNMNQLPTAPGISGNPGGFLPFTFTFSNGPYVPTNSRILIGLQQNSTAPSTTLQTDQNGSPTDGNQSYGLCTTANSDCQWYFNCGTVGNCMSYTLFETGATGPGSTNTGQVCVTCSPTPTQPIDFPATPPTTQAQITPVLSTGTIDSRPFILIAIMFFLLTLGPYLVYHKKSKLSELYEIRV